MKKKTAVLSLVLLVILLFSLTLPAVAEPVEGPRVIDKANILTEAEEASLEATIRRLGVHYGFDAVILTVTSSLSDSSAERYADDYYDQGCYGYGPNHDGILILVDMGSRAYHLSTTGRAIQVLTDKRLDKLVGTFQGSLSAGRYYDAFADALSDVEDYWQAGPPAGENTDPDKHTFNIGLFLLITLFGLIIAIVICVSMRRGMNSARPRRLAREYVRPGSFHLTQKSDLFLYMTHSKVRIQSDSGSSSTHRGSSGTSHGGRGGRF